jgi:Tfp pilus assembly protein PilV
MMKKVQHRAFSLTEVLLAVATLSIGMIFIGGTFFTAIHFTTLATERTIAAVAADEAFAKIKLYGVNLSDPNLASDRLTRFEALNPIAPDEFLYPSTKTVGEKQYCWSALCRSAASGSANRLVQVTVFVSRKVGTSTTYPGGAIRPTAVQVAVAAVAGAGNQNKLAIVTPADQAFIDGGSTIVENRTGALYRVVQRDAAAPDTIVLDRVWQGAAADSVWVIAPPVGGGRYPCIAIYQKLISF